MTVPPLPASPCIRVSLIYQDNNSNEAGNRLFFSYTGGPPTATDLNSLATAIRGAWATNCAPFQHTDWGLTNVDILDLASYSGASGANATGSDGTLSGTATPAQVAFNLKFNIARRYRGGKPKAYLPWGTMENLHDQGHWTTTWAGDAQTAFASFITAVKALSEPSIAIANHVNLSYYQGFKNVTNSSGRERAVPQYRTSALVDVITGYAYDTTLGSQRRRRNSTTP